MKGELPWQLKLIIYLYDLEGKQIPALYIFSPVFSVKQHELSPPCDGTKEEASHHLGATGDNVTLLSLAAYTHKDRDLMYDLSPF